ncbi:hypothetical protein TRVL_06838 [Trypanosoma vivax]|uniref:Secreted protein n=1 Tax=Trypanosoma vivax (strain Y486) TaxID=1055687 RepID=G0TYI3_TRYVY|nr:hypothetical protein TRVL_06838 [Trypanosoma vivax]CCC49030.1 hypothetical protein TVY486_0703640 [Trypanosoma vivax Y486]
MFHTTPPIYIPLILFPLCFSCLLCLPTSAPALLLPTCYRKHITFIVHAEIGEKRRISGAGKGEDVDLWHFCSSLTKILSNGFQVHSLPPFFSLQRRMPILFLKENFFKREGKRKRHGTVPVYHIPSTGQSSVFDTFTKLSFITESPSPFGNAGEY